MPFCLHSALFICTALIFNSLSSVDTIYTRLHFSTRVCTSLHASALSIHTTKRTKCLLHRQHHFTVTADNHACYGRPNYRLLLLNSRPPYTTANKCYHRNYNTALTSSVLRDNGNYTPQSGKWCSADSSVDKVHTCLHYRKRWFSIYYIEKCRVQTNLHYSPIGQLRHIMMHGSRYYFIRFFCPLSCK